MKCFLDANVLFSAANESSQMHRFIMEHSKQHKWITSDYARDEAMGNTGSPSLRPSNLLKN